MQTFEQIKLVQTKVCYSCLNELTNTCITSSGAVREAGSPEGQVCPHFQLTAVLQSTDRLHHAGRHA